MPIREQDRCPGSGQHGEFETCPVCDKGVNTQRKRRIAPHKLRPNTNIDTRSLLSFQARLAQIFEGSES